MNMNLKIVRASAPPNGLSAERMAEKSGSAEIAGAGFGQTLEEFLNAAKFTDSEQTRQAENNHGFYIADTGFKGLTEFTEGIINENLTFFRETENAGEKLPEYPGVIYGENEGKSGFTYKKRAKENTAVREELMQYAFATITPNFREIPVADNHYADASTDGNTPEIQAISELSARPILFADANSENLSALNSVLSPNNEISRQNQTATTAAGYETAAKTDAPAGNERVISVLPEIERNVPAFMTEFSEIVSENAEETAEAVINTRHASVLNRGITDNPRTNRTAEEIFAKFNEITETAETNFTNAVNSVNTDTAERELFASARFAGYKTARQTDELPNRETAEEDDFPYAPRMPDAKTELNLIRGFMGANETTAKIPEYVSGVTLERVGAKIEDYLGKLQNTAETPAAKSVFTMKLNPGSLGEITVEIVKNTENAEKTTEITITAEKSDTAELLRGKAEQITREITEKGTIIERFTVETKPNDAKAENARKYEQQGQSGGGGQNRSGQRERRGNSENTRENQNQSAYGSLSFEELLANV